MKPLFSAQQIKDLIAEAAPQAEQWLHRGAFEPDDAEADRVGALAIAALHFALRACDVLEQDEQLTAPFVRAALILGQLDFDQGLGFSGIEAITSFVQRLGIEGRLSALVDAPSSDVKEAVAAGLEPQRPGERELLLTWLASPDGGLSAAAQRRLEATGQVTWWLGRFAADPSAMIAGQGAAEAAARAWAEVAGGLTAYPGPPEPQLVTAFEAMPAPLQSLAAHAVLAIALGRGLKDLVRCALETPGGREALLRPFTGTDEDFSRAHRSCEAIKTCTLTTRQRIADTLLVAIEAASPSTFADFHSPLRPLTELLHAAWDPSWPIDRLMELVLREDLPKDALLLGKIADSVGQAKASVTRPWFERCVERRLGGERSWRAQHAVNHVITSQEDALVLPVVERALHADSDARTWALLLLFDRFHSSPGDEGGRAALLQRLFADVAVRPALFEPLFVHRALSVTRHLLLEASTPLRERLPVFVAAGTVSGSLSRLTMRGDWDADGKAKHWIDQRDAAMKEATTLWAPLHGGPLTDEEWRLLRAQRDQSDLDEALTLGAHRALPPRPSEADEAFIERLVQYALSGDDPQAVQCAFGAVLSQKDERRVPLLRRLIELDRDGLLDEGAAMIAHLFPQHAAATVARRVAASEEEW